MLSPTAIPRGAPSVVAVAAAPVREDLRNPMARRGSLLHAARNFVLGASLRPLLWILDHVPVPAREPREPVRATDEWLTAIAARCRETARMDLAAGDPGPMPVTKLAGVPWWPRGVDRPRCSVGHPMCFYAQVRLRDVPGLETGSDVLLSLHYCVVCMRDTRMSFGFGDRENRGYAVTLFDDLSAVVDGLPSFEPEPMRASSVTLTRIVETPGLGDFGTLGEGIPDDWWIGGDLSEDLGYGFKHVQRSKLGGWPTWAQDAERPECPACGELIFVAQLDWSPCGIDWPWSGGGYGYLFVCQERCERRHGELLIQTT